jgi:hypothetical protein
LAVRNKVIRCTVLGGLVEKVEGVGETAPTLRAMAAGVLSFGRMRRTL